MGARPRRRPVRRRRGRSLPNRWRVLGAGLALAAAAGMGWLFWTDEFELEPAGLQVSGLHYTDRGLVESTLQPWLEGRPSLFRLPAEAMAAALRGLPAVAAADVRVLLPDRVEVLVVERVPVFVWRTGPADFLVDASGVLLRALGPEEALPADLPLFDDGRSREALPQAGDVLDPVELEAVLKLGAVEPAMLDSRAEWLSLSADDLDGYTLRAEPGWWSAVFGHYTPSLRRPDIIERQVQCLRSLLAAGEDDVRIVYLSPAEERCGTYVARRTPEPVDVPERSQAPDDEP